MRSFKGVIILAVVLALLGGAYFLVTKEANNKEETLVNDNEVIKILELDKDKMSEIIIQNNEGEFIFKKQGEDWEFAYPEGLKADKSRLVSISSTLAYLTARKVVEEEATDLAQYGLDNPVTVTVKMKDGAQQTVELGNKTFTKQGYYLKKKGNNKVYVIGAYDGDKLKGSRDDLRDKTILSLDKKVINYVTMERGGHIVFKAKRKDEVEWEMLEPLEGEASYYSVYSLIDAMTNTKIVDFIEENPQDLGQYGLDNPRYVLEVEAPEDKVRLLIGKPKVKGSEIYAKFADDSEVFTVTESSLDVLDKPLKEIVDVFAYIVNIDEVEELIVEIDGEKIVSEITMYEEDGEKYEKFVVNGVDVTDEKVEDGEGLFRKFYGGVIGVTISDVEMNATPTGEPEITFTYHLKKEPGKMKVEFIPKDERYYYVMRNGEYAGVIVEKEEFDEPDGVRKAWKILKEAIEKSE